MTSSYLNYVHQDFVLFSWHFWCRISCCHDPIWGPL